MLSRSAFPGDVTLLCPFPYVGDELLVHRAAAPVSSLSYKDVISGVNAGKAQQLYPIPIPVSLPSSPPCPPSPPLPMDDGIVREVAKLEFLKSELRCYQKLVQTQSGGRGTVECRTNEIESWRGPANSVVVLDQPVPEQSRRQLISDTLPSYPATYYRGTEFVDTMLMTHLATEHMTDPASFSRKRKEVESTSGMDEIQKSYNICKHGRHKVQCRSCTCEHGRIKSRCRDCGTGYCKHKRRKCQCKDCGTGYCVHRRVKYQCKDCGTGYCEHGRRKHRCKECDTAHSDSRG
jgi:hypothetical protein